MTPHHVLFLCTGNSARSIIAEALLNDRGQGRFQAYSAGSHPRGEVHPLAIKVLEQNRVPTAALRSRSWNEFATAGAPPIEFVFTVCDHAAQERCPIWPGHPMTAHWGIADPAAAEGSPEDRERAFVRAFQELEARIKSLVSLPLETLDAVTLRERLNGIGATTLHPLTPATND